MTTDHLIGQTINDRYKLESLLGDGGMGAVYRALDVNLDRQVAIKLMHTHFARKPAFRARLVQEAQTAAQLDHPSVVKIFDFGDSDHGLFIAMEFVDGGSLRDHLRRLQRLRKYLPMAQSLQIGAQIADALDYAHKQGIIHRDVKPGNIILKRLSQAESREEQPFRALLSDFGLVKLSEGSNITQSGATLGTPTYMSPEQTKGHPIDGRSDLYALGVVLYELFTNRLPFTFQNLAEALSGHNAGDMPITPSEIRDELPRLIDDILIKMLAKEPNNRYASGAELANVLRQAIIALDGAPTRVMPREELNILDRVSEPPPGWELHIFTPDHPTSIVPLTQAVITLGRNADNDVVLPADGVSRHHARLQATALGWELLDLGGLNGTMLNDRRLRADDPTPILVGSLIKIGPYELKLEGPEITQPIPVVDRDQLIPGATTPRIPEIGQQPPQSAAEETQLTEEPIAMQMTPPVVSEQLSLFLPNDNISVDPGEQVEIRVEVVNRSEIDDRVSVRVQGLPASWVTTPSSFVPVKAGGTVQLGLIIRPPRQAATPSGRQRFRLELISQQFEEVKQAKSAFLVLSPFVEFEATMEPQQLRIPGDVKVRIRNQGNQAGNFSLVARDAQNRIQFKGERGRIPLQPGQSADVLLELAPRSSSLLGGAEQLPFEVEVFSNVGGRQQLLGEAQAGTQLPTGLLYGLVFVGTLACALFTFFAIFGSDGLFGSPATATVAVVGPPPARITETAVADITATFNAESAATVAAGNDPNGDPDQDGLTNSQEVILKTNPNNRDSDGDGLDDGDELARGLQPTSSDSDGDSLPDGEELSVYGTDPTNPDSDGDGFTDGVEVAQGTDPRVPQVTPTFTFTPQPQATATTTFTPQPQATATSTFTPQPQATATNTFTPQPQATPTNTSVPSATPTNTNTPLPPSSTSTPTITPTPSNTPLPNPDVSCINTPPAIDGIFLVSEWGNAPAFQFEPAGNSARRVQVYFRRDVDNLYLAFLINDNTVDVTDSLRVYFDTTNSGGDPDTADRFFQIVRDGVTKNIQAGIGSSSDTNNWNGAYTSANWLAEIGEAGNGQWVVELEIDAAVEMGALTDTFGLMVQVLYTGELATWPEAADSVNANTWQDVNNASCS